MLCLACSTGSVLAQEAANKAAQKAYKEGREHFDRGEYQDALGKFRQAYRLAPGNLDINFYLGRAAFESGDYETPIMAFERVIIGSWQVEGEKGKMVRNRARLELGRSHFRLGLHDSAEAYLREVLASDPPETVRQNVEQLLSKIEGVVAEKTRNHTFGGRLELSLAWETNVGSTPLSSDIALPSLGDIVVDVGDEETDYERGPILNLWHRYDFDSSPVAWRTFLDWATVDYSQESDYDTSLLRLASGPSFNGEAYTLDLQGVYELIDKGNEKYAESRGAKTTFATLLSQNLQLTLTGQVLSKRYFQDPQRQALNGFVSAGPVVRWGANEVRASVGLELENAEADETWEDDEYSYNRFRARVRYKRKLPEKFWLTCMYRYWYTRYDATDAVFLERRVDKSHQIDVRVGKKLSENVSVIVGHRRSIARSSIELYRYTSDNSYVLLRVTF